MALWIFIYFCFFLTCSVSVRPVTNFCLFIVFVLVTVLTGLGLGLAWLGLTVRVFRVCFTWTCSITVSYELRGVGSACTWSVTVPHVDFLCALQIQSTDCSSVSAV